MNFILGAKKCFSPVVFCVIVGETSDLFFEKHIRKSNHRSIRNEFSTLDDFESNAGGNCLIWLRYKLCSNFAYFIFVININAKMISLNKSTSAPSSTVFQNINSIFQLYLEIIRIHLKLLQKKMKITRIWQFEKIVNHQLVSFMCLTKIA